MVHRDTKGTYILHKIKGQNLSFLRGRASAKIRGTLIRIGLFTFFTFCFVTTTFTCHFYESKQQDVWENSLREFLKCTAIKTLRSGKTLCSVKDKPNIAIMKFQLFSLFGTGIMMSSWTWTKATIKTWKKAWMKFRGFDAKKRIQLSCGKRNNRRRIGPLVQNAIPAAVLAVPSAPKAAIHRGSLTSNKINFSKAGIRRGSLTSNHSTKHGLSLRLASIVSNWTSGLSSRLKPRSAGEMNPKTCKNTGAIKESPLLIRPPEGRRGTLLSIESLLTTSSDGRLFLRRGSLQMSVASASEHGRAFGHIRTVKPQVHQPSIPLDDPVRSTSNLRVIRLGEEFSRPLSRPGPKFRLNSNRVLPLDENSRRKADNIDKETLNVVSSAPQQVRRRSPSRPNSEPASDNS